MARVFLIFCATHFALTQIVFSNIAKDNNRGFLDNATDHVASEISGRYKRSLLDQMPGQLTLRIKFPTGQEINLKWMKSKSYLANEHLPVITMIADLHPNVMYDFGEFVAYHDEHHCSAVVYFGKLNLFYGVIGINHYIEALPYNFNEKGEYQLGTVGEPYILENNHSFLHIHPGNIPPPFSDEDAWIDFFRSPGYESDRVRKHQSDCHTKSNWSYQDPRIYLEILLFITKDIVDAFKEILEGDYIHWIIRYHIVYFNAVDMMFKYLRNKHVGIHINIAKIVIEDESLLPFDFMSDGDNLQFTDTVDRLSHYLQNHQLEYPPDSFDHVFIHTRRTIMDYTVPITGLSRYGGNLYSARKLNRFYNVVPISIVKMKSAYADYVVAVHQIGRTFDLEIEPSMRGLDTKGQCESIMQRDGPKCRNCLTWSYENLEQFEKFRSRNKNICFLLNAPRSLRRSGPSMFLRPHRQCQCFGYDSYKKNKFGRKLERVPVHECLTPLSCQNFDLAPHSESTVRPFDGTPCSYKKVCWNGKCMEVIQ